MLLQPLSDLHTEINRLMIAGSRFASNDPRLAKLLPIFQKMGEKAPVFQKIADNIEALLKAPTEKSAETLTVLSTLLYAVLYTQGKSTMDGNVIEPKPMMNIHELQTPLTYLELEPTITALTSSGSGRYEVVLDAYAQNLVHDIRLHPYLAAGLEDKYSELSAHIGRYIIPHVGKPMIPFLLQDLTLDDQKPNAARIAAWADCGYQFDDAMIQSIMNGKATKLQEALLPWLSKQPEYSSMVLAAAKSKKRALKDVAIDALSNTDLPEAWEILLNIFKEATIGESLNRAVYALRNVPHFHGRDTEFAAVMMEKIDELLAQSFTDNDEDNLISLAERLEFVEDMFEVFINKPSPELTEKALLLHEKLSTMDFEKMSRRLPHSVYSMKHLRHAIEISIANYIAHITKDSQDPLFLRFLASFEMDNDSYTGNLLQFIHYNKMSSEMIFELAARAFEGSSVCAVADDCQFLIKEAGISNSADLVISHYYIPNVNQVMTRNADNADPRWQDLFFNYCDSQAFLEDLALLRKKNHHYNFMNVTYTLAITEALEPKDSQRMNDLLIKVMDELSDDHIGAIFKYLEERLGKAAHPIILARAEKSPDSQTMNLIKEIIHNRP